VGPHLARRSRDGTVYDQIVQEVDIKTGAVLFEWHSLGAIGLSESHQPLPKGSKVYDPVHINSIDEEPDGNILVSARHTHAASRFRRRAIAAGLGGSVRGVRPVAAAEAG
jgi:Arylsulfotransferase (ASST)